MSHDVFGIPVSSGGGDFLPYIKYQARAGIIERIDRIAGANGFENLTVDITTGFVAQFDLENIEVGWLNFASKPPSVIVVPMGAKLPDRPSDGHRYGLRVLVKLAPAVADGTARVRELTSPADTFRKGMAVLYEEYLAVRHNTKGQLPIVKFAGKKAIKTQIGAGTTTNYQPVFEISGWAPRGDFVHVARSASAAAAANTAALAGNGSAPTTGAQPAQAPVQRVQPSAPVQRAYDPNDFG